MNLWPLGKLDNEKYFLGWTKTWFSKASCWFTNQVTSSPIDLLKKGNLNNIKGLLDVLGVKFEILK